MMKLLKYELQRRRTLLPGAAIGMLFIEGAALYGIYRGGNWNTLAIAMTMLLAVGGLLLPMLDAVTKLYADYKQKQGYLLFLTPQGGYRILLAKTVFGALEIAASMLLICGCLALSAALLDRFQYGAATALLSSVGAQMGDALTTGMLFTFVGLAALQMIAQMCVALLAVTVSRAMVQSNRYNWLISLAMYFALAVGINMVNGVLLVAFGFVGDVMRLIRDESHALRMLGKYFAISAGTYAVWAAACTAVSGRLAGRSIDL
ncbi:MAG: hypothetical protein BWY35_02181 [Firmicutes bacterium ADurb.Bin248]|nr:MAG: hypothetical protein BWY35_02181 [Firmicutes bacterium ADurb.Bin248]HOF99941.1 hypothetical protein [Clostridia bacterium]HPK14439.1 hypothetical protein [Clostridia bacterium]